MQARPSLQGLGDERFDVPHPARRGQRTDLYARVRRVAHPQCACSLDEQLDEALEALPRHIDALDRTARLARSRTSRPQCTCDCALQVRVGEHEHRVLAAQLERDLLLGGDARSRDHAAHGGRAREEDLVNGSLRERHADLRAAVRDAHHSLRQISAAEYAHDALARQCSAGRRLERDAVARQQRSRDLSQRLREGRAAGADHADHAIGLIRDPGALGDRQRAAGRDPPGSEHVRAVVRNPDQRVDRGQQLECSDLGARAPLLARQHLHQLLEFIDHRLGHAAHVAGAVAQPHERPQRPHLRHRLHDLLDLLRGCGDHAAERLASRGIACVQDVAPLDLGERSAHVPRLSTPRALRICSRRSASSRSASSGS